MSKLTREVVPPPTARERLDSALVLFIWVFVLASALLTAAVLVAAFPELVRRTPVAQHAPAHRPSGFGEPPSPTWPPETGPKVVAGIFPDVASQVMWVVNVGDEPITLRDHDQQFRRQPGTLDLDADLVLPPSTEVELEYHGGCGCWLRLSFVLPALSDQDPPGVRWANDFTLVREAQFLGPTAGVTVLRLQ